MHSVAYCKAFQTMYLVWEFLSGQNGLILRKKPLTSTLVILSKLGCFKKFELNT